MPMLLHHPALAKAQALRAPRERRGDEPPVELRLGWASDAPALARLAQVDSAPAAAAELPDRARDGDVLIATVDGRLVAALSLVDGLLVSDPFERTDRAIALLHLRRRELARAERRRPRLAMLRPRHS
jgi:hypothetical protein